MMTGRIPRRLSHLMLWLFLIGSPVVPQSFQQSPLILTESRPTVDTFFGSALAIGDFNGDGILDLAVSNRRERVFVFYGRPTLRQTPDRTLSTREAGIAFGSALASGDWNRDNRTDLAIGAPEASNSEDSSFDGRVFIYRGASNFGISPVTIRSPLPPDPDTLIGGFFGDSLASGNVDGDQASDLIAGAWLLDAVVILYGGSTIGSRRTTLRGTLGEQFGLAVAAGDINKDGFADVVVGAPLGGTNGNGAIYVFFGGKSMSGRPNLTLLNPRPPAGPLIDPTFASSLAVADLNGDGYADIVVGDSIQSQPPRVYIYFGGPAMSNDPNLILEAPAPQLDSRFGYAVATGDLNGDRIADLAVGAIGAVVGNRQEAGRVYVFQGGSTIGPNANLILDPPSPEVNGEFGTAIAIGDLNRDGKPDLAVGEPGGLRGAGRVIVYLGR
ncbi:MAG: FG-GAP-like repeat-containing protein [Blastocatellia bacterium]|nr:FG-GAP-like repeat-containing protein [Blastocatellia bacterium]MDW8169042.1 FG-GAP-like repeat-containing protein [Acidobacteriota bacterium]MDW8256402.1 FG-GAP-like repeat-containing protein [Acidobacteriota bacterium]